MALAKGTGNAVVKAGGKTWYFLTADYAFGHSLQADTATVVKATGGTVVGTVAHPLYASDFSSFLLQAQSSARPRSWAWPTPAATPSTRSRRPTSSASPRR